MSPPSAASPIASPSCALTGLSCDAVRFPAPKRKNRPTSLDSRDVRKIDAVTRMFVRVIEPTGAIERIFVRVIDSIDAINCISNPVMCSIASIERI